MHTFNHSRSSKIGNNIIIIIESLYAISYYSLFVPIFHRFPKYNDLLIENLRVFAVLATYSRLKPSRAVFRWDL